MVDNRVCSEQQGSFYNKSIAFYGKLWKRAKDGSKYQKKRKGGESNRVCKKNEEDARRSGSCLKKGPGRNEVASGQQEKRSGNIEKGR